MPRQRSALRLFGTFEVKVLNALKEFVNVKYESPGELWEIFRPDSEGTRRDGQRARVPIVGRWNMTPDELRTLQREMRAHLVQITGERRVGPKLAAEIDEWLQQVRTTGVRSVGGGEIAFRLDLYNPREQCMYAMFLLRDTPGLAKRINRCLRCGLYFFVERPRTGPPNKFCPDTQHRNRYNNYYNLNGRYPPTPPLPD